jgi:hypothetical protein
LIRYPDLIFVDNLPTFSSHTFELGIVAASSDEHEIDIDREIEKRSKNIESTFQSRRPKSLAISSTTPLLSDFELTDKLFADSNRRRFIDVGGGPSALPSRYHTEVKLRRAKSSTLATSCVDQRNLNNGQSNK